MQSLISCQIDTKGEMEPYLSEFMEYLEEEFKGSLVKVSQVSRPHAKEYLGKLANEGDVERVSWGWYWVPADIKDIFDFLRSDVNFKVVSGQTAASFWNGDFVHRDVCVLKVRDGSYSRALERFCESRGWDVYVECTTERLRYVAVDGIFVELMDDVVMDCLRRFAFQDAMAVLFHNMANIDAKGLKRIYYWNRLPRSKVRLRQILDYALRRLSGQGTRELGDEFVRRNLDEALDRVMDLG